MAISDQEKYTDEQLTRRDSFGWLRVLIFSLSFAVMILVTAWPHFLGKTTAEVNHTASMLLMLGMSSGFIYGINFTPQFWLWRYLFSAPAALILMFLGIILN